MNKNLPISELNPHKFIQYHEITPPPPPITINRKMFFPVALEGGTDTQGNGTFTTKKVNWVDMFRSYAYSQQNITDLLNILQKYDLFYTTYFGDTPIEIIDGKIDLKPILKQEFYNKTEIDELLTRYDDSSKLNDLIKIRTSYDIQYYSKDVCPDLQSGLFTINYESVLDEDEFSIDESNTNDLVIHIKHPFDSVLFNNTVPNIKLYEKVCENNADFNICPDNYKETLIEVISQKQVDISNNVLDIKLHLGLTKAFEGKLIIN